MAKVKVSPLSGSQAIKVLKALGYSLASGFVGGFAVSGTGVLVNIQSGGHVDLNSSFAIALVIGGVVGALNGLAVTVKQLLTPNEA